MSDPIPSSRLRQSLEQLHAELAQTPQVDAASRQLLREVLTDIERLLVATPAPAARASGSTLPLQAAPHRLEALAVEFEADHPALAASLRQFVDLLGRAGV